MKFWQVKDLFKLLYNLSKYYETGKEKSNQFILKVILHEISAQDVALIYFGRDIIIRY